MNTNRPSPRKIAASSSSAARRRRRKLLRSAIPELLERRTLMSAYLVTTAADLGTPVAPGSYQYGQTLSLRQAIALVNADSPGSSDVIAFNFYGTTQITVSTPLPAITNTVLIDGTPPGQTNYTGAPDVWLSAASGSSAAQGNGLTLSANSSGVNELAITGFGGGAAVEMQGANDFASHDYLGVDPNGGVFQMSLNGVEANNYGVSVDGVDGVVSDSVLSNNEYGVQITADGASVTGNFIGTDPTGTQGRGNSQAGVNVLGAGNVTIGGADRSLRNIVSGNFGDGIDFIHTGAGDQVIGNYIGLDVTGTNAVPIEYNMPGNGGDGIYITGTSSGAGVVVGGTLSGDANVISSNMAEGLAIFGGSGNRVEGNLIGTDASGLNAVPNGNNGVDVEGESSDNVIGGFGAAGNLISGNYLDGIYFFTDTTTTGNVIAGNIVGVNLAGTNALPNSSAGVEVYDGVTIGVAGAGNVISGNAGDGVDLDGSGNVVEFNAIGSLGGGPTAVAMGNAMNGVTVYGSHNTIGANGSANTIAYNGRAGVAVGFGTTSGGASFNDIEGNFIFANSGLGIDLGSNGVTADDSAGHSGPNELQDFPVLSGSVTATAGILSVSGTLANAAPGTQYTIDLYNNPAADPSGHGQGQTFVGSQTVTIGSGGAFTATFAVAQLPSGTVWSATATDASGNTSEFSADLVATATVQKLDPTTVLSSSLNAALFGDSVTFTASVSGSNGLPTGTLSLYDGPTLLSSLSLSGNSPATLTFTISSLAVASHSISVVYSGDGNYNPSSASLTEIVNVAATSNTLLVSPVSSLYGQDVTLTATVAPTLNNTLPSGSVTFLDGSTVLGTGSLSGGVASLTVNTLGLGAHSLVAQYGGDSNFGASTSNAVSQSVHLAPSSIGGTVFTDPTGDGFSTDDTPLAGVTVNLFQVVNGSNSLLASQSSGSTGQYLFNNLGPGTYFVQEVVPAGSLETAGLAGYTVSATGGTNATGENFDNFQTVSVTGNVYNDLAGNGISTGDPGLAGVTIELLSGSNVVASTTTLSNGSYTFANVGPGTFSVSQLLPSGWMQTGGGSSSFSTVSGQNVAGGNFGDFELDPISGTVYTDVTGNGSSLTPLAGVTVQLLSGGNVLQSMVSGTGGTYCFGNLGPGSYTVQEVVPGGSVETIGAAGYGVVATSGQSVANENFANFQRVSISGTMFRDLTGNGFSSDDTPFNGGTVSLFLNGSAAPLAQATTASNGAFSFANLGPGTYSVQEVVPAGYTQTGGKGGYQVVATSGQNVANANFDNYLYVPPSGAITGYVFSDDNLDGVFDKATHNGSSSPETGLSGATVTLSGTTLAGAAVKLSTTSNSSGFYSFSGLAAGHYTVNLTAFSPNHQAEASHGGVVISYSTKVTLAAGQTLAGKAEGAASTNNGLDFAEIEPGSLAGVVWADTNNDGAINHNEVGIVNVTVKLTGTTYTGAAVSQSAVTNNSGQFHFSALLPGTYTLTEVTPSGFADGKNALGTLGGSSSKTAFSSVRIGGGADSGTGYDFAESAGSLASNLPNTGTLSFWHNGHGQALLLSLNGGSSSKALGNWLAAMFPKMYGSQAKANFAGMTNAQIAAVYSADFGAKSTKVDASVLAAALSCYVTNSTWAGGNFAAKYGFAVTLQGVGYETVSVGSSGSAFGMTNGSNVSILQALALANQQAVNGLLYNGNSTLRSEAFSVFSTIAQNGLNN